VEIESYSHVVLTLEGLDSSQEMNGDAVSSVDPIGDCVRAVRN